MKIRSKIFPLALCTCMVLFFLFVPEKISEFSDYVSMGKTIISRQNEKPIQKISLQEGIRLINAYGKSKSVICLEQGEDKWYDMSSSYEQPTSDGIEVNRKNPNEKLLGKVETELNKLQQIHLLPEMNVKWNDMEPQILSFREYIDLENDNKYVSFVMLEFFYMDMSIDVSYDILNEKLLSCYIGMPSEEEAFADITDIEKKWGEYLEISADEIEKYYIIDSDRNEEMMWMIIALKNE